MLLRIHGHIRPKGGQHVQHQPRFRSLQAQPYAPSIHWHELCFIHLRDELEALMKTRIVQVMLVLAGAGFSGLTGGCSMSGSAEAYNPNIEAHPIDGLNRNSTEGQMGVVQEAPSPPPVRKDFASDR